MWNSEFKSANFKKKNSENIFNSTARLLHFPETCRLTPAFSSRHPPYSSNYIKLLVIYTYLSLSLFTLYSISSSSPNCTSFCNSHLHFVLYENVNKFPNPNVLVLLINFVYGISSFICCHF